MPGSELCLEGPACTADKSMCLCIRQRDTSHTQPVPSPAAALLWTRRLGGRKLGSGSPSPRDTAHLLAGSRAALQPPLRAEAAPWKLQRQPGLQGRGLTTLPQAITTGRGVFSKLREAEGPSPPPREDTTHRHTSTARPGAQEAVNRAELREAAGGGTHLSGTRAAGASPGGPSRGHTCPVCLSAHRTSPRSLSRSLQTTQKATTEH